MSDTRPRYLVGCDIEVRARSAHEAEMQVRSALAYLAEVGEIACAYVGEPERYELAGETVGYRLVKERVRDA